MPTLKDLIVEWNGGYIRGAQAELSKRLKTSEATISRWLKGELRPSQRKVVALSEVLKKSPQEIENSVAAIQTRIRLSETLMRPMIERLKRETANQKVVVELTMQEWGMLKSFGNKKFRVLSPQEELEATVIRTDSHQSKKKDHGA